ncbi:MAG TPA: hypothetical protein VGF97_07730 [Rhizomicrobium sp.]|jgi:hypothetical protein
MYNILRFIGTKGSHVELDFEAFGRALKSTVGNAVLGLHKVFFGLLLSARFKIFRGVLQRGRPALLRLIQSRISADGDHSNDDGADAEPIERKSNEENTARNESPLRR